MSSKLCLKDQTSNDDGGSYHGITNSNGNSAYSLSCIKIRNGADEERVRRRRLIGVYLGCVGPTVPVPAGEGTALADAADDEQEKEDEGGDGRHHDVQPALSPQLGPAAREAREEEHIVIPVSPAQVVPAIYFEDHVCMEEDIQ